MRGLSLREKVDQAEDAKLPAFSPEEAPKPLPTHPFDSERRKAIKSFAEQAEVFLQSPTSGKMVPEKAAAIQKSKALVDEAIAVYESSLDGVATADANLRTRVETRTKTLEAFNAAYKKIPSNKRGSDQKLQDSAGRMVEQWGIYGKLAEYQATSKPLSETCKKAIERKQMHRKIDAIRDAFTRSTMRDKYAAHCDKQRLAEIDKRRLEQMEDSKRKRAQSRDEEADAAAAEMPSVNNDATFAQSPKKQKSCNRSSVDVILKTKVGLPSAHGGHSVHEERFEILNELNLVLQAEFCAGRTHPTDVLQTTKLELMWAERADMRPHTLALLHKAEQMHSQKAEQMHYDSIPTATLGSKAPAAVLSGPLATAATAATHAAARALADESLGAERDECGNDYGIDSGQPEQKPSSAGAAGSAAN